VICMLVVVLVEPFKVLLGDLGRFAYSTHLVLIESLSLFVFRRSLWVLDLLLICFLSFLLRFE